MGLVLKENFRAIAIAVVLVAAGLFCWYLADLTDCRDHVRMGSSAGDYPKSACPKIGPNGPKRNVFLLALLSPLFPTATAEQQNNIPGRRRAEPRSAAQSLAIYLVPAREAP
jgi:hypothetical protein